MSSQKFNPKNVGFQVFKANKSNKLPKNHIPQKFHRPKMLIPKKNLQLLWTLKNVDPTNV